MPNSLDSFPLSYVDQIQFSEKEGNTDHNDNELPLTLVPNESENLNCSICMESFGSTDLISWSPRVLGCYHAFHKACIREWLLRHRECPCCRQIMLPVDVDNIASCRRIHITHRTLRLWTKERNQRYHETVYCASKGVIDIDIDTLSHSERSSSMDQFLSIHSETCVPLDQLETHGMKNVNGMFDQTYNYEPAIPESEADTIDSPETHVSLNFPVSLQ
jgi:Ring finger domain